MRGICLVLALLGVPVIAAAQHQAPNQRGAAAGPISGSSLPSLGSPLPSIGLSPRATQPRQGQQRDWQQRGWQPPKDWQPPQPWIQKDWLETGGPPQSTRPQSYGQSRRSGPFRHRPGPAIIYVQSYPYGSAYPYYGMPSAQVIMQATTVPGAITVVPEPATGRLLLEVEPADILQVFVNGEYVGTPADLGSALDLQPGSWRIEFRAPGYKTLTIDAQIVSQRTIVYRATLERIAPTRVVPPPAAPITPPATVPPPAVPSGNRTMYLIPGCYMGNVPPQDLKLPAGCDLSRLTTITP